MQITVCKLVESKCVKIRFKKNQELGGRGLSIVSIDSYMMEFRTKTKKNRVLTIIVHLIDLFKYNIPYIMQQK